ncbi:ubiquitin-conjugating enzyme/RWD-like protein [Xylariomycetidae sp. FL0641]|nr:ubiquitin-conjugating enzyme/RWD-like protein [Xylariomycetidae sp. FL0641]
MAKSTAMYVTRMMREVRELQQENPDFKVFISEGNLTTFDAYVFGPADTPYEHKLIRLQFTIPQDYPFSPPNVKFIQHSGSRIHPNFYPEGKVCLSILGTWQGEPWDAAARCETVLLTIRSLFDNHPYTHEPGQTDDLQYNAYVRYASWRTLLLDYVRHETEPDLRIFLDQYLVKHGLAMRKALAAEWVAQQEIRDFRSPYAWEVLEPDYLSLMRELFAAHMAANRAEARRANGGFDAPVCVRAYHAGQALMARPAAAPGSSGLKKLQVMQKAFWRRLWGMPKSLWRGLRGML